MWSRCYSQISPHPKEQEGTFAVEQNMANSNGLDSTHLGKAVVTFSGRPGKQPSEWRIFEQLFLATIREIGLGDVLTGRVRQPQEPTAEADAGTTAAHKTESLT